MFEIDLLEQRWLEGCEPAEDLCSHGRLRIVIGDHVLTDGELDLGISESALGLLRTLTGNRRASVESERLILHGCGTMLMSGCPIGIDWDVEHRDGSVRLSNVVVCDDTRDGAATRLPVAADVPLAAYRRQIVGISLAAKEFFAAAGEKEIDDPFDRQQYDDFWREFDERLAAAARLA